jgi:CHAT domain-containing protein
MQPVTLAAVKAALPADAALVEFAVFRPFDPKAERPAEAFGAPHYAAYVLRRYGPPRGVDLGSSEKIDRAIDELRHGLRDPRSTSIKEQARAVDELVLRRLRPLFSNATRLLISTDGNLNLVPFEALVDEKGSYLIERYATSYVTSGRDLLRMQTSRPNGTAPVIVADPLFGEPASVNHRPTTSTTTSAAKRAARTASALSTVYFPPLAATADEARAIRALFPDAALLTGRQATKAALQTVHAPRILHIASHGFFLHDAASDDTAEGSVPLGTRAMVASVSIANPLLRSGLALAGANLSRRTKDDGILTALEASGLNLWGTKLVTLSACDTGLGEVRNGEGVYGLRRAFVLAGTETLVMSLWPVSDSIARDTMVAYYAGLQAGLGRGDALREAKLAMLRRKARQHPFYWASFIQSGEWTPLDGTKK